MILEDPTQKQCQVMLLNILGKWTEGSAITMTKSKTEGGLGNNKKIFKIPFLKVTVLIAFRLILSACGV